jgi:transposase
MDGVKRKNISKADWQREYRELDTRHRRFIKRYDQIQRERYFFKEQAYHLEADNRALGPQLYQAHQRIDRLKQRVERLQEENHRLKKQLQALEAKQPKPQRPLPAFVKLNAPARPRKRPGREAGHPGAFRAMPEKVDREVDVPFARNADGICCCPKCRCQLLQVEELRRIVEDIVPCEPVVECYHTQRGYCPKCDKLVESRAAEQPPAADIPGPQVGINALAMAAVLRVVYRLPYEPITQLLADLSGLKLSKATIARQMQRMSRRLEEMTRLFGLRLKLSDSVHMDETSWRVDGKNQWLWTLMNAHYTLFHVDKSRGGKVVKKLLGEVYGGTLHTDFYSAYGEIDCKKQKCLVHLLRELRETAQKSEEFARGDLFRRLKRLIKEMLVLKKHKGKLAGKLYQQRGRRLEQRLKALAEGNHADEHSRRIANRLKKHEGELTLFLWDDAVRADNNAAERALRPAVILRKITGGSRSERGAKATAILMSIARTIRQHDLPLLETFKDMLMASWANKPFDFPEKTPADSS